MKLALNSLVDSLDLAPTTLLNRERVLLLKGLSKLDINGLLHDLINTLDWDRFIDNLASSLVTTNTSVVLKGRQVTTSSRDLTLSGVVTSLLQALTAGSGGVANLTKILVGRLALANNSISNLTNFLANSGQGNDSLGLFSLGSISYIFSGSLGQLINQELDENDTLPLLLQLLDRGEEGAELDEYLDR